MGLKKYLKLKCFIEKLLNIFIRTQTIEYKNEKFNTNYTYKKRRY